MPLETVPRTWTIASWLVPHADAGVVGDALAALDADAIALQSITEDDVERLADRLRVRHAWELSYYPTSRLLPGSGVGLAVLTRHAVGDSASVVANNHSSTWSRHRRIAHFVVVERSDHSGYTIGHAVGVPDPESMGAPPAPLVWFRPEQVGIDDARSVDLPAGATVAATRVTEPIAGAPKLFVVTFDMPWVQGDFPVA
ncbi:MAG: hypothetical protein R8G01_01060 [Ilumatobacteraceae bacterium]|nr:hypothetical protein [Ilumatobacteraceae bacterium]